MTNAQQNRNKMQEVTLQFFSDHPEILTNRKALSDLVTEAKVVHTDIATLDTEIEENRNTGVYGGKKDIRSELQHSVFYVEQGILVYAQLKKDTELAGLMKYLKSDLIRMSDTELETAAGVVLKNAKKHLPDLKDVDLTQEDVTELERLLDDFSAKKTGPRTQIVSRSEKITTLGKKFARMKEVFGMIDGLMEKLSKTEPSLYSQYKSARRIEDRGGKHTKVLTPEEIAKKAELKQTKLAVKAARAAAKEAKEALKEAEKAAAQKAGQQDTVLEGEKASNGVLQEA